MPVLVPERKSSLKGFGALGSVIGAGVGAAFSGGSGAGAGAMAGSQVGGEIANKVGPMLGTDRNKGATQAIQSSDSRATMERRLGQGETPMMALKKASAAIEHVPRDVGVHYEQYINEAMSIAQRMEESE